MSGYGIYSEISSTKKKMDKDNFFDVYDESFTDWSDAYNKDSDIDINCIKKSLSYRRAQTDGIADVMNPPPVSTESYADVLPMKEDENDFWYSDPAILWENHNILPNKNNSFAENLNALVRLTSGASVALAYWYHNPKYLLLIIAALLISVFLYSNDIHSLKDLLNYFSNKQSESNEGYENSTSERNIYWEKRKPTNMYYMMEDKKGRHRYQIDDDQVCAAESENDSTGGYDWIGASSHAEFRGNSRLVDSKTSPEIMQKLMGDLPENYGKEIASRNSYIAVHPRDFINTNPEEFFYGKNLDRRLYYGRR